MAKGLVVGHVERSHCFRGVMHDCLGWKASFRGVDDSANICHVSLQNHSPLRRRWLRNPRAYRAFR